MRKVAWILAAAAAFVAAGLQVAKADYGLADGCEGEATCVAVTLGSATIGERTVVNVRVTNIGSGVPGEEGVLSAVAILGASDLPAVTVTQFPANWVPGGHALKGFSPLAGANANAPPPTHGIRLDATGTFEFTFDGALEEDQLASLGIAVHFAAGPGRCSSEVAVYADETVTRRYDHDPDCRQTSALPEAMTMILLGTGMAGLIGAARRRGPGFDARADHDEQVDRPWSEVPEPPADRS